MNDSQSSSKAQSKGKKSNWLLLKSKLASSTKLVKKKAPVHQRENGEVAVQKSVNIDSDEGEELEGDEESHSVTLSENNSVEEQVAREQKSAFLQGLEKKMRKVIVGLDCEMVGLGHNGKTNALARCSIVNFDGKVLYDQIIRPKGFVTDFRTKWSGIKKSDLRKDKENVVSFEECQESVAKLLKGKILVGHALQNDMSVLLLSHPRSHIRDTSRYRPYMRQRMQAGKFRPRSLKELTFEFLGKKIQSGEHDSVEDARCAVLLYRREMENWEKSLIEQRKGLKHSGDKNKTEGSVPSDEGEDTHDEEDDVEDDDIVNEERPHEDSNNQRVEPQITMEELQPQKKKKLSIKYQQSGEATLNLISQLINETKKVDSFVHHSQSNESKKKKKRKFADLTGDENNNEEGGEASDKGVIVFEDPRDHDKDIKTKKLNKKNMEKKKNSKEGNKKKRISYR